MSAKETSNKTISNNELVNYLRDIAKEMAMAVKINEEGVLDQIFENSYKVTNSKENIKTTNEQFEKVSIPTENPTKLRLKTGNSQKKNNEKEVSFNIENSPNPNISLNFDDFFNGEAKGHRYDTKILIPKNFYEKKINEKLKFERKLDHLRKKKEEIELSTIIGTPYINDNSRMILEKKNKNRLPIQDRVQSVILNRHFKMDTIKSLIKNHQQVNNETKANPTFNKQKFDFWVKAQQDKLNEKNILIEERRRLKEELEKKQLKSPNINRTFVTGNNKENADSVHQRLYREDVKKTEKKLELIEKYTPSFKPTKVSKPPKFFKNTVFIIVF